MDIAGYRYRFSDELYYDIRFDSQSQLPHLDIDTFKVLVCVRGGVRSSQPNSKPILPKTTISFSSFELPFHSFFNVSKALLYRELSHPDIPVECAIDIISEAVNLARSMMEDTRRFVLFNLSPKAILMAIDVIFEIPPPVEELLKKVKFEGGEEMNNCSICLLEFNKDEEVSAMPCLHGYHRECIVKWLDKSPACPLCRRPIGKRYRVSSVSSSDESN